MLTARRGRTLGNVGNVTARANCLDRGGSAEPEG
jgi:hypothetical protein